MGTHAGIGGHGEQGGVEEGSRGGGEATLEPGTGGKVLAQEQPGRTLAGLRGAKGKVQ
jgi:hypothetical protein